MKLKLRKLELLNKSLEMNERDEMSSDDSCFLVQQSSLSELLSFVICPKCHSSGLSFKITEHENFGLAVKGAIYCNVCENTISEQYCLKA